MRQHPGASCSISGGVEGALVVGLDRQRQLELLLGGLYPGQSSNEIKSLSSHLLQSECLGAQTHTQTQRPWSSATCVLICYADSVIETDRTSLPLLRELLNGPLLALSSIVHVLPFWRSTSDGGFAISSHEELEPRFGDWKDLEALSHGRLLMADLVLNHVSASHPWVHQCLQDSAPGSSCILQASPDVCWSDVVRPRSSPLISSLAGRSGSKQVWTTFGPDQVDLNWQEPEVLRHFNRLMQRLFRHGVGWLRLDAVGYVWKERFTSCIHRPQAHAIVQVLRLLQEAHAPGGAVVTETNVPEAENLSYLRSGREAHLAYNFPLPPLLLEASQSERCDLLNRWLAGWPELPEGTNLLNFSASHDGVGLRPLEGLMDQPRLLQLLAGCEQRGGLISHRRLSDGTEVPYEINISWWSAMADPGRDSRRWQRERFLLSQRFKLALPGVPAFYLPALLAAPNDTARFQASGHRRDLNRPQFHAQALQLQLQDPGQDASLNVAQLQYAMEQRANLPALDPDAPMRVISAGRSDVVILERGQENARLWAIHNFTATRQSLVLASLWGASSPRGWIDHLNPAGTVRTERQLELEPFGVYWISSR